MLEQESEFTEPKIENKNPIEFLKRLSRVGAVITPDMSVINSYRIAFENGSTVTIKINFEGENKEELVITNMGTFPETEQSKGSGGKALKILKDSSKELFPKIIAVQVNPHNVRSVKFWIDNGFKKCEGDNYDYEFVLN